MKKFRAKVAKEQQEVTKLFFLRRFYFLFIVLVAACGSGEGTGERLPVQVPPGASFAQITDSLENRGIIKYRRVFKLYARMKGADARVRPAFSGKLKRRFSCATRARARLPSAASGSESGR